MDQTGKKMSLGIEKMFAEIYKSGNLKEVTQDNITVLEIFDQKVLLHNVSVHILVK